jgi:hypothetical protein
MTATRDPDRLIHAFVLEGEEQLEDQVYDAVRAAIESQPQRAVLGPWRTPIMNKYVTIGLGAAAVILAVVVGAQFLGSPDGDVGDPGATPTGAPSGSSDPAPETTGSPQAGDPAAFVVTGTDDPVQVTLDIASDGWEWLPEFDAVSKDDDGRDPPQSVGVALLAWSWPAGTGFNVYGDPCQWLATVPETPATTPEEIAAAFAAQASTDATAPVDVTVGGYAGKAVTLSVPMTFDLPDATREERFADCDEAAFAFYGIEGEAGHARNAQGAGQIDELWILDVDGAIVILDAAYGPAASAELVEELRILAESATFEVP